GPALVERNAVEHASVRSKSGSKLRKVLRALLVAVAITGTAVSAAACGPSHDKQNTGPGGY
ncbi:MAG: hypothetical protein LBV34_00395, partial [Nocardiopsaceae bacterium]|nr:hypothetical protein [Nocardiopsaceae bacterium]